MEKKLKSQITVMINAPVTKVWQALTTAAGVKEYFFGNEVITDWNVGSTITFKGEWKNEEYLGRGIILNSVPYMLFRFSYWSSLSGLENKSENYLHVTYKLVEENDEFTKLITSIEKLPNEQLKMKMESDLKKVLESLKEVVESEVLEPSFA
jgi:uncharacterized protein YndB with AHSA1/START domain